MRTTDYQELLAEAGSLTEDTSYDITDLANISALLFQRLDQINWAGFYLLQNETLLLGPFQGKPACMKIPVGKGVCGTAVAKDRTMLVPDVCSFEGHIACDPDSRSEIVIPIHVKGQIYGVLDIDSAVPDRFSETDREGLESLVRLLETDLEGMREDPVSVKYMRDCDAYTIRNLVPSKELMRRAGEGIFRAADWKAPVAIICGKGNNAGDGFVAASCMKDAGIDCEIILLSDDFSEDGKYYYDQAVAKGVPVKRYEAGMKLTAYKSILDCLFGTGFSGSPREAYAQVIREINESGAYVVSADINSGMNGDSGKGQLYVLSDLTVSIGMYKYGHFKGDAYRAMKKRVNVDIGIVRI